MRSVFHKTLKSPLSIYFSVLTLYAVAFSWPFAFGNPIRDEVKCGWDGTWYCLMFQGQMDEVAEPFRRRLAPPILARMFGPDPIDSFLTLNLLAMVVVAITSTTIILLSYPKSTGVAYRWVTAIGFASVVAFSRNTFHHFVNAPVLTDYVALAAIFVFGLGVFVTAQGTRQPLGLLMVFVAVPLAAFSREALGPALMASGAAMLFNRHLRWMGVLTASMAFLATAYTLLTSNAGDSATIISGWIVAYTSSWQSVTVFGVMLALSLGVWPIILLLNGRPFFRRTWTPPLVVLVVTLFALSVFGGGNLDRILLPVGLLIALVAAVEVKNLYQLGAFGAACYGMVLMQYPFYIMPEGAQGFLGFIDLWHSASFEEVLSFGAGGILMSLPLLVGAVGLACFARRHSGFEVQTACASNTNSS